ncbi:hypothetical protein [Allorhizocola rhizosphaerae]|uniref:hypothetical protein n=1 Tax=Allorhizocola rhizosphaerae TaxID=1872709 RepID=UPI0013C36402|nr:hypothetical protein [Allorhizocola rhizosphaerae]
MTAKKTLRIGVLATAALAIGLVLLGSPASASPSAPQPIVSWFAYDAGQVASDVLETRSVGLDASRSGGVYTAGAPVHLHNWNPAFVAGTSAETVVARDEWVAALYRDGQVVGTIAAVFTPDGKVAFAYADDDVTAGKALVTGEGTGKVVADPRMGGLVEVTPDGKASGLSAVAAAMVERLNAGNDLRAAVRKAHQPSPMDLDSAEGGSGVPAESRGATPLGFGLALALAGLVLWLAWRRPSAPLAHRL